MAEREELRKAAINILLHEGFSAVSMSRLASDVGMSLRTLHRYFPSKADILWGGTEQGLSRLRDRLANAARDVSPIAAAASAIGQVIGEVNGEDGVERARLRIIALNPDLQRMHAEVYLGWQDETEKFLSERLGDSIPGSGLRSVSVAIQAVVADALYQWAAKGDTGDPAVHAANAVLALNAVALR